MRAFFLAVAVALILIPPALAQTSRLSTGEHEGFTRLVLSIQPGTQWKLGRTENGYAVALGDPGFDFDLSTAFTRIGRQRIADLRAEGNGRLQIDLACRCHALPFEFRPDMLVIDIRDGTAPPGSSFELGLDGAPLLPLSDRPLMAGGPVPAATGFDWSQTWLEARQQRDQPMPPAVAAEDALSATGAALRDSLLREFSRAAANGLVDPVDDLPVSLSDSGRPVGLPPNLRLGEGLTARPATGDAPSLAADGQNCPHPDQLAIESWGDGRPAAVQFAESARALIGEFDRPEAEAVAKSVRLHLHFGFGAEAGQLLAAFPTGDSSDPLLRSIARIVDGLPDPAGPFPALAACDGPAALWSALSDPSALPAGLDRASALRSFSALPPHLRRALGPTLAEAFLAADDLSSATTVVEAILRLPGKPDDRTTILAARLSLLTEGPSAAEARLRAILADPGPEQATALLALVDLHLAERRPLDPDVVTALEAYRAERADTASGPAFHRAHALALALTGDYSAALAEAADRPEITSEIWDLAAHAPDEVLIMTAIGGDPAAAGAESRARIAERLANLGFLPQAQRWAGSDRPIPLPQSPDNPTRAAILARAWQNLPTDSPPGWSEAARSLQPGPADLPPLAGARALAENSATTRAAIQNLLGAVPRP